MKKILKFSLVLVALIMAMNVSARGSNFSIDVKKGEGKTVIFALNESSNVELSIYDLDNKLIHQENVSYKGSIKRTYDLNALPEGTYYLNAESDTKVSKYEIKVIGKTAVLATKPLSEFYKPIFVNNDGIVSLRIINVNKTPVSIKIFNQDDELVFTTTIKNEQNIKRVFNIKNLPFENYTFIMNYGIDKTFEKTVSAK